MGGSSALACGEREAGGESELWEERREYDEETEGPWL